MPEIFCFKPPVQPHLSGFFSKADLDRCVPGPDLIVDMGIEFFPEFVKDIKIIDHPEQFLILSGKGPDIALVEAAQLPQAAVHLPVTHVLALPPGCRGKQSGNLPVQPFPHPGKGIGKSGVVYGFEKMAFFGCQ